MITAAGHGFGQALFPLIATAVAAVFCAMLGARFAARRRIHEFVWAVALLMFAVASFATFLGVWRGWTPVEYRVYWIFGLVLNVLYLAQGELYLLARGQRSRGWAQVVMAIVAIVSVVVVVGTWSSTLRIEALSSTLPQGKEVWAHASIAYQSRWLAWIGYLALLAGLTWSTWRMRGHPELRDRTAGTLGIALGATIVAVGTGVGAGYDVVPVFSVGLAVGVFVMFVGFLRAGRRGTPSGRSPASSSTT